MYEPEHDHNIGPSLKRQWTMMVVFVAAVLHSRAPDLPEAAQQCGGVGRRERGVPLRCSRRPCSHCPLEKR